MPEGDTVYRAAAALHRALAGRRIERADLRVPGYAVAGRRLSGQTVTEVVARGKHLLLRTDGGMTLHTHLKMDGSWRLLPVGGDAGSKDDTVRVVIQTAGATAIGEKLGIVELLPTSDEPTVIGHLGPDLLGEDWDAGEALRRLGADPGRPIGDALIDQRVMAGLGNIYRSELCFLRGVDPATPVRDAGSLEELIGLAHRVINANRATGHQVTTGDTRRGRSHWVYGRAGMPCRRCGTTVRRRTEPTGERGERVTYWCPSCQPLRGAAGASPRSDSRRPPRTGTRARSSPRTSRPSR